MKRNLTLLSIAWAALSLAGNNRERAAHWAGLRESRVVDRPGSAELLPRTWAPSILLPPQNDASMNQRNPIELSPVETTNPKHEIRSH